MSWSFSKYTQELDLPPEFADKSNDEIIAFLRERAQGGEVEVRRVKALLLGPGEAGKTTLLHRLATGYHRAGDHPCRGLFISRFIGHCNGSISRLRPLHTARYRLRELNSSVCVFR